MEELIRFVRESAGLDDTAELARRALTAAMDVFPSEFGWIHIHQPNGDPVQVKLAPADGTFKPIEAESFEAVIDAVMSGRRTVYLESTEDDGLEAFGFAVMRGPEIIGAVAVGGYASPIDPATAEEQAQFVGEQLGQVFHKNGAGETYQEALERFEKDFLTAAMEACEGNITAAARRVGLSRNGLKQKLRRLGISVKPPSSS
jgi:DNA-binding NtrC family response regulator